MTKKSSKVFLEMAGRDSGHDEPDRWVYRVIRLVNTLEPRVDSMVRESAVNEMIQDGFDVTITPRSERS
jgi:hypothetical protein